MDYKEIKSYADACKALGVKPLGDEVFNAFPKAERENVKAYHQLTVITRAINEGWEPDYSNHKQRKYEPYAYTNTAGLAYAYTHRTPSYAGAHIGSRLCFRDYERAAFAVDTFNDLYLAYFLPGDWEDEETQEPEPAAGQEPENREQPGGDGEHADTIHEEDDMSDAPDFLQKVVAVCKEQIEPLCDNRNKGIILIAVEDGVKDEDGDSNLCMTVAVHGREMLLSKGFARFIQHKRSENIVKGAYIRIKFDRLMKDGAKAIREIVELLK